MRTLVVTNDFPPRPGGIQQFVHALTAGQPADDVVVYASTYDGAASFDAQQPFPVVRDRNGMLLPTPRVLREVRAVARSHDCDTMWFGASAPLGLLAGPLRDVVGRFVASTHGHELIWARAPVGRQALRRIGATCDVVTFLGDYLRQRLAGAFGSHARLERLPSGVDTAVFRPGAGGADVRARHGLSDRPVVVCVSRLVQRKGQDVLINALPRIRERVPGAALLLVGGGPDQPRLARLADERGVTEHVRFTGGVAWAELPAHYDAGDVFAMPCRNRYAGLEVEGLGIVFLEAAAAGLPVVAGRSGGSPDAVRDGDTGVLVDGRHMIEVADAVASLLADPDHARAMGERGRAWVERDWQWDVLAARLRNFLVGT